MKITNARIIHDVEEYYGLFKGELVDTSRSRTLVKARQLAVYLMRTWTDSSYPEIANSLMRDHQTIMHAYKMFDKSDRKLDLEYFEDLYRSSKVSLELYNVDWSKIYVL